MNDVLFPRYAAAIGAADLARIATPAQIPDAFTLTGEGRLRACYIPFESVNTGARVVIVGITPGFNQWKNAIKEAQRQLSSGADPFLGRKDKAALSSKTDSGRIDAARVALLAQMAALVGGQVR
ncbi:hypothetical protein [Massilia horti]|uniref:Uncharacterized protein n=1 Tax=Massilia horti TaxID=2562153 RepID=A0A4Y9T4R2_9BURK|nr:hypothetical protein [Massilia horti]TFW34667.1 hypothetical protein E4O92_03655 [Massilia horti]